MLDKLQKVRVDLQNLKIKKTGKNDYSKYSYYELSDLLPAINVLCAKNGLFTQFGMVVQNGIEMAKLTVYDSSDATKKISFTTPTAEAEIGKKKDGSGGADPIQNLGGKITYLRRYLLMVAFEVVEADTVEQVEHELNTEITKEDMELILNTKSTTELSAVCAELKSKYKMSLIAPIYEKQKQDLTVNQDLEANENS